MNELIEYYVTNGAYVWNQFIRHFLISAYGVLFASLVAVPLGFYIARHHRLASWLVALANLIQTIPSLAMLSILMMGLGIGANTVIVTVFLYSLLPILKNTYAAVNSVDKNLLDVAKGMGMTRFQVILRVEFPLALSVILGGIRNAMVLAIGITAIGTFIGAGGLGDIISRGIKVSNGSAIVFAGALPTAFMAVAIDFILGQIERKINKSQNRRSA